MGAHGPFPAGAPGALLDSLWPPWVQGGEVAGALILVDIVLREGLREGPLDRARLRAFAATAQLGKVTRRRLSSDGRSG